MSGSLVRGLLLCGLSPWWHTWRWLKGLLGGARPVGAAVGSGYTHRPRKVPHTQGKRLEQLVAHGAHFGVVGLPLRLLHVAPQSLVVVADLLGAFA